MKIIEFVAADGGVAIGYLDVVGKSPKTRLKPISLEGMTIEQALKKAMDAGPYPESEAKRKPIQARKKQPSSASPRTSPAAPRHAPRAK